ncbi:MAG: DUF6577 family protein [Eubacteriales bacterium]
MQKEIQVDYLQLLKNKMYFSRCELKKAMSQYGIEMDNMTFDFAIQELLRRCEIARVGRNAYCVVDGDIQVYNHQYSQLASSVAKKLEEKFPYLEFTIFELTQLNEFVNHQLAHNTIFISVENDLGAFVFEELKQHYSGKVFINPTPEMYHQYWLEDMIVIGKLVTEAPKERSVKWNTRIEKLLVDLRTDILLQNIVSSMEIPTVYEEVFLKYAIDESSLFRYAKRRGADKKIKNFIQDETNIQLRRK